MSGRHSHDHNLGPGGDRRLGLAIAVNLLLTVAQVAGGLVAGSLALIADALHNLSDAAALVLALVARRIAVRPADTDLTFGYRRAEVVGALINLTVLVLIGVYLIVQAGVRLLNPEPVTGWLVVTVAGVALVVDLITAMLTWSMARHSMNIRAAFIHNLADALASIGVIVAGVLIILYEFHLADVIATLLVAGYVLIHAGYEIRGVIRILMNSAPGHLDLRTVCAALQGVEGVEELHHAHLWSMDESSCTLDAHVVLREPDFGQLERIRSQIKARLAEQFDIHHSTLEFEFDGHEVEHGGHDTGLVAQH